MFFFIIIPIKYIKLCQKAEINLKSFEQKANRSCREEKFRLETC